MVQTSRLRQHSGVHMFKKKHYYPDLEVDNSSGVVSNANGMW